MQEKIDLIQKKLEIVIKLTEIEKINAPIWSIYFLGFV